MRQFSFLTRYHLRLISREGSSIFWVLLYPIILTTLIFQLFAGNNFDKIPDVKLGVPTGSEWVQTLNEVNVLKTVPLDPASASEALSSGKIDAYWDGGSELEIKNRDINQDMIWSILDEVRLWKNFGDRMAKKAIASGQTSFSIPGHGAVSLKELQKNPQILGAQIPHFDTLAKQTETTNNTRAVYFYALLAMFSLYGYYNASDHTIVYRANSSPLAIRTCVSPVPRLKGLLSGMAATFLFSTAAMAILVFYMEVVLKLNVIREWPVSILLLVMGMLFGIAAGMLVGSFRVQEWLRVMIGTVGTLLMAVLAGMMNVDVRNSLEISAPIVNRLNPVGLLSETFYSVNQIRVNMHEVLLAVGTLAIYIVLALAIAATQLGRRAYKEL